MPSDRFEPLRLDNQEEVIGIRLPMWRKQAILKTC